MIGHLDAAITGNWGIRESCRLTASDRNGMGFGQRPPLLPSFQVGGRVVTLHFGGGEFGEMMAALDDAERMDRRIDADLKRAEREGYSIQVQEVFGIDHFLADVFALLASRCGYYQHRRQWRRTRRTDPMSLDRLGRQIDELQAQEERAEQRRAPLIAPDFGGIPEADRATLPPPT